MPENLYENLPLTLKSVLTSPLFVMHLDVKKPMAIGATPGGNRRIAIVPGGTFNGGRLSGQGAGRRQRLANRA